MTTSRDSTLPFVLTYAEPIVREDDASHARYDPAQQLSQVWTETGWVDAAEQGSPGETKITKVERETTDDD